MPKNYKGETFGLEGWDTKDLVEIAKSIIRRIKKSSPSNRPALEEELEAVKIQLWDRGYYQHILCGMLV